jgi:translation initiation factor IF-2
MIGCGPTCPTDTRLRMATRKDHNPLDPKNLGEAKKQALDLFAKGDKSGARKSKSAETESSVFVPLTQADVPAAPPVPAPEVDADAPAMVEIEGQKIINLKPPIVVKDLAELMGLKAFKLIQDLMTFDVFANPGSAIEPEIASKVCEKHGFVFEREKREKGAGVHKVEEIIEEPEAPEVIEEDQLKPRPPVVTFMGHVDHGKTSLLDYYRGSKVVDGEAGGITQHVGAYSVERGGRRVTFIDTPGHEAFTEMRARGAMVTDIVVLVVAADDGLMPTTLEAIDHCRAAEVTIVVALNKCDLPRADVNRVKGQLQEKGLSPEDWGGSTLCVEVSAKTGMGLEDLFENICLQAEILELKANPTGPARGIVIEARSEAGKGPTASVIIQSGTLKIGVPFICGRFYGKVKALVDDCGKRIDEATPATPVEVIGFSDVPHVGDELVQMESERLAKKLSEERCEAARQEKLKPRDRTALEKLFANIEEGSKKTLRIILKCDVQGSVEAIVNQLREIKSDKINVEVLRSDAGPITESDILLASASDAIVIGFNTKVEAKAVPVVKREGVQVKLYSIIYELLDQVKAALLGMLDPLTRENVIGHAEVREVFKTSNGRVGGCYVTDGRIDRKARARVLRGGQAVYDGGLHTLRRFKDDVNEVRNGFECGIKLGDFNDYMQKDIIECYELERIAQSL